jgi:hypothetical protein
MHAQSRLLVTFAEPEPPLDAVVLDMLTEILDFIRNEVMGVFGPVL